MMRERQVTYGPLHRLLHWLTAMLIILLYPVGWYMVDLDFSDWKLLVYDWHKWVGLVVLTLSTARILLRAARPVAPDPTLTRLERLISVSAHRLFYFFLFALPVTGWAATSALDFPVVWFGLVPLPDLAPVDRELGFRLLFVHKILGWGLLVLFVGHIAGVAYHHFFKRDRVLHRMTSGEA